MNELDDVIALVKRLDNEQDGTEREERRAEGRYPMVTPVHVQPVDDTYQPIGDAFMAVSRDISRSGMSLVHSRREESPLLAIRLEPRGADQIRVIMQVNRCDALGSEFFEFAGEFIDRL